MRRICSAIVGALLVVVAGVPAGAGGALLDFDREFYVPGDVVHASSGVWLKSARGRLEHGPYFAYVSRYTGLDSMPSPAPADAQRVAEARIEPRDHRYGDVYVEFPLPDLEPGKYWVTICNDPCKLQLGDVMPTTMTVVEDDVEGRAVVATERVRLALRSLQHRMPDGLRARLKKVEAEVERLGAEVEELRADAARPAEEPPPDEESSALPPLLAFVVPAAVAGILLGRRSRSA